MAMKAKAKNPITAEAYSQIKERHGVKGINEPLLDMTKHAESMEHDRERLREMLVFLIEDTECIQCTRCDGTGKRLAHPDEACHQCAGAGEIVPQSYWPQHVKEAKKLIQSLVTQPQP